MTPATAPSANALVWQTPTEGMLAAINARVVTIEEAKLKAAPIALWTATTHRVKDKLNVS
jgi:hypothetical protein